MNKMNRISFLVMAFVMAFLVSCNQGSKSNQQQQMGPGGMGGPGNFDPAAFVDRQMEELKEGLDLSDDQEKQVREIITAGFENMRKSREEMQDGGDREAMREKMQAMREEQNQKIKAVLSAEQFTKYEQIQEERRERMRQNGGGQGGPR
jgi:periplasmic protein CpxP/Spy